MNFFDDDPFENIVREFFGQRPGRSQRTNEIISGEEEERVIDFLETPKKVFLIFEIPGYNKEDVSVRVDKGQIEITAKKKNIENVQTYLSKKLRQGVYFKKLIPKTANSSKFNYIFKNGILEVAFDRK